MSYWEAPGQTQDSLEILHVPSGLGTPRDPPGGAEECHWGEGCLGFSPGPTSDKRMKMDEWRDKFRAHITSNVLCNFRKELIRLQITE